ncbi:gfo/Idh/MocA family oxidoreductase [bacterium]|nr:gfo/Idh/MocA family oxidoreductase [bacterium]
MINLLKNTVIAYQFAIVGHGHIGRRHRTIIDGFEGTQVSAVIDSNPQQLQVISEKGIPTFESLDAFFVSGAATDVVSICTPNGFHCQQAIAAIERGYHVLIEKPMGLSRAECERVVSAALCLGKNVFVVKQNRYTPPIKWLKELVQSGSLGDIYQVKIDCFWNRDERYYTPDGWRGSRALDGGVLFTQFSHFVDIMYWIFGDVHNISTRLFNFNHQHNTEFADSGNVLFDFEKGGSGMLNFSTSVFEQNLESTITIIAANGSVKIGGQYMNEIEYCHIKNYQLPKLEQANPPNDYGPFKGSAANHHYVIENVVNTLSGKDTISTNAMEGMKVVDIIERMYGAAL